MELLIRSDGRIHAIKAGIHASTDYASMAGSAADTSGSSVGTRSAGFGDASVVVTETGNGQELIGAMPSQLKLCLRSNKPKKSVQWKSDVVDNEHLGKKKSKGLISIHR